MRAARAVAHSEVLIPCSARVSTSVQVRPCLFAKSLQLRSQRCSLSTITPSMSKMTPRTAESTSAVVRAMIGTPGTVRHRSGAAQQARFGPIAPLSVRT